VGVAWSFIRNTTCLSGFESVKNIIFMQNRPFQVKVRSSVSLIREPLMLQVRESSTLFSIVNWLS
jgi:hypothetical protein